MFGRNETKCESRDDYDLENGTPQGSVISSTIFNIMINDLEKKYG